jgi:hypothetical protein
MTQFKDGDSPDDLCGKTAIQDSDLINEPDRDDSTKTTDRLIGRELVWVEGHMRITGDARLFGTRVELRDSTGTERTNVPLYVHRAATVNADGGEDLEVAIGGAADGKSKLTVGVAEAGKAFAIKMQLKNDGRLAVGPTVPPDVKAHTILATSDADTSVGIATAPLKTATIQFATTPALTPTAHIAYDDNTHLLRLGVGTDLSLFSYIDAAGKVGMKFDSPATMDADANDLVQ